MDGYATSTAPLEFGCTPARYLCLSVRKCCDQPNSISKTFCAESTLLLSLPRQLRAENKGMCSSEGIIECPQRLSSASNVAAPTDPRLLCPVVEDMPLKFQGLLEQSTPTLHSADGLECETIVRFLSFQTLQPSHTLCQTGSRRHGACDVSFRRTVDGLRFGGLSKYGSVFEQCGPQGHRCR